MATASINPPSGPPVGSQRSGQVGSGVAVGEAWVGVGAACTGVDEAAGGRNVASGAAGMSWVAGVKVGGPIGAADVGVGTRAGVRHAPRISATAKARPAGQRCCFRIAFLHGIEHATATRDWMAACG